MRAKIFFMVFCLIVASVLGVRTWQQRQVQNHDSAHVLYGNVEIRQISAAFDGNGRILALYAEEGDYVQTGELLGIIDTRSTELQAEQAEAQIEVLQQNLLRLQNGFRPLEIAQAHSRLAAARAEDKQAAQDLERLRGIAADSQGSGVSEQDLERAQSRLQVTKARVDEQTAALQLMELGSRSEDIAGAFAQLKAAEAQLAVLQHHISQGKLLAPADAVVRTRLLEPGDMATAQKPVFALALNRPKWVRVYIEEPRLSQINAGMEACVIADGQPDRCIVGKVGYISSVAEFTPKSVQTEELRTDLVYEMRVHVDDREDILRLGQPVTVRLTIRVEK